jgi:hypothetical protein
MHLCIILVIVDNSDNQQYQQASKKTQRKEFVQRMHARNGNAFF